MGQLMQELNRPASFVVLVEADQPRGDSKVTEQVARPPRVFGGDDGNFPKHAKRAWADVLEVADGRGHDEQRTGHILL